MRFKENQGILRPKEIEWAYEKWCEGYTLQQISDALYVCPKTVHRAFKGRERHRPDLVYPDLLEGVQK